jgi:FAD:protein FMN transferase
MWGKGCWRWWLGLVAMVWATGCEQSDPMWQVAEGEAMGMRWKVQARGGSRELLGKELAWRVAQWEAATSHWREDSELMRFNAAPMGEWVGVSDRLWMAVELAWQVAEQTDGALDITLGPLVEVWGFGPQGRHGERPSEAAVEQARQPCGWRHLERDEEGRRLKKRVAGLRLNVAAVVEGLVLEEWAGALRELGVEAFLLELGGELLAVGESPRGGPWLVAVQAPEGGGGESMAMLPLLDAALATSGTYRHQFEEGGRWFSHLLDPRTGRPVAHELVSVTVQHERAALADGYATALLVLGPVKGREVAARLGLRVFWIEGNF